jgi:hypothetical protein
MTLLGAALIAVAARADDSGWREFHSRAGGFLVEVPAEPRYLYSEDWTLAGKVIHHHYVVEHPAARFDLERLDLPAAAVFFFSSRRLLERAKNGYIEELDAIVESTEAIEVQGYPGLRLLFRHRGGGGERGETWFVLVGRHLYMLGAGPFLPEARSTMVERVFSSFRICLDEHSPCEAAEATDSD